MSTQDRPSSDQQRVPSPTPLRIVLADDHEVVRSGLQLLLDAQPDFEVVAQAGDVKSAQRCVRERSPHVLVLDLNMPGESALDAIPRLRTEAPDTQIVVLTMRDDPPFVREAWRSGALGYVLKEEAGSELAEAIRRAAAGERYITRHLASRLVADRLRSSSWD